ncbi:MAG: VWA domain-containing protein [Acidobacteriota bacterium]
MRRALALLCISVCTFAQDEPVFRSGTRLVQVDVVVRTKKGAIGGLTKDQFKLFDNGKPQVISTFVAPPERGKAEPLPPGAVSNRLTPTGEPPSTVTVILVDHMNTTIDLQPYMHKQVEQLAQRRSKDRLAIMVLTDAELRVVHDFTDPPEHLVAVMKDMTPERWVRPFSGSRRDLYTTFQNLQVTTTSAMQEIARHLANVPGRKNLIWISGSFPMFMNNRTVQMDFTAEIAHALQPLSDANVAVYPVDARGLISGVAALDQPAPVARRGRGAPVTVTEPPALNTLNYVAEQTGGKAYYNTNGIADSVEDAIHDSDQVYTLGFYPAEGTQDDAFHKLRVRVDVKGADVRARPGYLASKTAATQARQTPQDLLRASLDSTAIGLLAQVVSVDGGQIQLQLSADLNDVFLQSKDGTRSGALDVLISDGATISSLAVPIQKTEAEYREALSKPFGLTWKIPITTNGNQVRELRIIVQDHTTGAAGSVRLPVTKP